jgi:hypothetical protein
MSFFSFESFILFSFESCSYAVFLARGYTPWCGVQVEMPWPGGIGGLAARLPSSLGWPCGLVNYVKTQIEAYRNVRR